MAKPKVWKQSVHRLKHGEGSGEELSIAITPARFLALASRSPEQELRGFTLLHQLYWDSNTLKATPQIKLHRDNILAFQIKILI
jgi:hypothetical protein